MSYTIFVSYSRKDRPVIDRLAYTIEFRTNLNIWKDTRIRPGWPFTSAIESALDKSDVVLVFWSAASIKSDFVIDEATRAKQSGKLLPARIEDVKPPAGFGTLQTIDLTELPEDMPFVSNEGVDELIFELTRRLPQLTDLFALTLSAEESQEYDLLRRVANGLTVFTVFASRENLVFIPLERYLRAVGFRLSGGTEPEEMSGREMTPYMNELELSDVVLICILPSMLVNPNYMRAIYANRGEKPTFVLLMGSINREQMFERYPFLLELPEDRYVVRPSLDFSLVGKGAEQSWELISKLVGSIR